MTIPTKFLFKRTKYGVRIFITFVLWQIARGDVGMAADLPTLAKPGGEPDHKTEKPMLKSLEVAEALRRAKSDEFPTGWNLCNTDLCRSRWNH